jgi:hypothetical protein
MIIDRVEVDDAAGGLCLDLMVHSPGPSIPAAMPRAMRFEPLGS